MRIYKYYQVLQNNALGLVRSINNAQIKFSNVFSKGQGYSNQSDYKKLQYIYFLECCVGWSWSTCYLIVQAFLKHVVFVWKIYCKQNL